MAQETETEAYKAVLELVLQDCALLHLMKFETQELEVRMRAASMLKSGIMIENALARHAPKPDGES